ncbi:MAG TPA: glycosyl hydrolase, partial [Armatimonadota bacterium]|nr:glycosyl hydrolase [Armatimonadota bacterium]
TRQENILTEPGTRVDDGEIGQHADVLVQGDNAYIFYFVHPQRNDDIPKVVPDVIPYAKRRSSLQVAKLEYDGRKLVCDRNAPFHFELQPPQQD